MSEKVKNYLGVAIIIAVLITAYGVVKYVNAFAKSAEPSSFRSFNVSGEGKVVAVPDIASFTFSVVTEGGKDVAKLQQDNVSKMDAIIEYVKSKGVDAKDIKTQGYYVNPRYQNYSCAPEPLIYYGQGQAAAPSRPCPPAEIVGYTVTQEVLVKVRDFGKAGDILTGVTQKGANQVSGLNFTIDDRTKVEQEAREEAIAKAKSKANDIAKAGGFRLGRLLAIEEGFYPTPYYSNYNTLEGKGGADMAPIAARVEPGSQDVIVTVNLRYEIQ